MKMKDNLFYDLNTIKPTDSGFYELIKENKEILSKYKNNSDDFIKIDRGYTISFGWKIHISVNTDNYTIILKIVLNLMKKYPKTSFKFLKSIHLYEKSSYKNGDRASFGKFIVIYPNSVNEFKDIIEKLYNKLKKYEGPYILSDKRYKDCKVLYYRYGSNFLTNNERYLKDGFGNLVKDEIKPYYILPEGIKEIFPENENIVKSNLLDNYIIKNAICFRNSGGIYLGKNKHDNKTYIIKEARPFTLLSIKDKNFDAISSRKNEALKMKELSDVKEICKLKDYFYDWKNFYLISEYVNGTTLENYISKNSYLYNYNNLTLSNKYIKNILKISLKIAKGIKKIYDKGFLITDISPDNIIIYKNIIKFIDLESCININNKNDYIFINKTLGFYPKNDKIDIRNSIYSISVLIIYSLIGIEKLILCEKINIRKIFKSMSIRYNIDKNFISLLEKSINFEYSLDEYIDFLTKLSKANIFSENKKNITNNVNYNFNKLLDNVYKFKNKTQICLFPNDNINFNGKPLQKNIKSYSITNGSSGMLYLLNKMNKDNKFLNFNNENNNNISLFYGISGTIFYYYDLKKYNYIENILNKIDEESIFKLNHSLSEGQSGVGIAFILGYLATKKQKYIDILNKIYLNLSKNINKINISGLKNGYSGIALFYLYFYLIKKDKKILETGIKLLKLEQKNLSKNKKGILLLRKNENIRTPSFAEGSCGYLAVLLRYYKYTKNNYCKKMSIKISNQIGTPLNRANSYFNGTSGIGTTLLDCYFILKDKKFFNQAEILKNDLIFNMINYKNTKLTTSDNGEKIVFDLGTGFLGNLYFLYRFEKNNIFPFLDFYIKENEYENK